MNGNKDVIATNLRYYRKGLLDLTQEQLSEAIDYSVQTISKAENGRVNASIEYLMAFARFANVSLDVLCGMERNVLIVDGLTDEQFHRLEQQAKQMRTQKKR